LKRRTRRLLVSLTVAGALALAPAAFAQSSGTGYAGQSGVAGQVAQSGSGTNGDNAGVAGQTTSRDASGSAASEAAGGNGVLAFTGLDLAFLAGGGLVLLGSGVALSRLVSRNARVADR
jgi:hypothetical protein